MNTKPTIKTGRFARKAATKSTTPHAPNAPYRKGKSGQKYYPRTTK